MAKHQTATPTTPERLYTRRDISGRWQVSIETLKRREKAGILKPLKLGHVVRYRQSDIAEIEAQAIAV